MPAALTERKSGSETRAASVPPAGDPCSQPAEVDTAQVSVPEPAFRIVRVCAAGFAPPTGASNDRLPGSKAKTGAWLTVKETLTTFGEFAAPGAVTVRVPACGPAASPMTFADRVTVVGAPGPRVPPPLLTESQDGAATAVQVREAPPVFWIVTFWLGGFGPPSGAVMGMDSGLTVSWAPALV